jgi:site-specific recombinase XerD
MNNLILSDRQQVPASQNPSLVYLASLSQSGRRTQQQALRVVAEIVGVGAENFASMRWAALRYQHTAAIRARLTEKYSPASCNKILSALRGALRQAWKLGLMSAEDYQRAADLDAVTGETLPAGRELSAGEIGALIRACQDDDTPAGARDAAIIGLLYAAGLRRAEIVTLDLADFDAAGKLLVRGKRSKERTAYINDGALDALTDWLTIRGSKPGALFCRINKAGKLDPSRLTTQAIYNLLTKRGAEAGVEDFSPHDFRRTFISDLLDKGADISIVSKMAGHANVTTTARYDRRPEEAKQKASKLLHVPYRRKRAAAYGD